MEIEALGEPAAQRYEGALMNNLVYVQRWVDVETVNETVAEVKAPTLELDARGNTQENVEA